MVVQCVGYDGNVDILEDLNLWKVQLLQAVFRGKGNMNKMEMALDPNDLTMVMWLFNHI